MPINFLDMFAGIGGFRSGLERLGGYECVGYCEIDKYAKQAYDAMYPTEGELYFADARTIDPYTLPDIDLICGGFPCQSFSIAGLRRGFGDDTRGTLFFEIARIAAVKRPPFLLLEDVPEKYYLSQMQMQRLLSNSLEAQRAIGSIRTRGSALLSQAVPEASEEKPDSTM